MPSDTLRSSSNGEPKGSLASFPPPHDAVRSTAKETTKWNHASRGSQPRPWVSDPYEGIQAAHFGAFANPSGASGGAFVLTVFSRAIPVRSGETGNPCGGSRPHRESRLAGGKGTRAPGSRGGSEGEAGLGSANQYRPGPCHRHAEADSKRAIPTARRQPYPE